MRIPLLLLAVLYLASSVLTQCHQDNCLMCGSDNKCTQCKYSILVGGECKTDNDLPDNCMIGTADSCAFCDTNYGLSPSGKCILCSDPDCVSCSFPNGKEICSMC